MSIVFHLLGLGLLAAVVAFFALEDARLLAGPARRARGVVIGHRKTRSGEGGDLYFARILFATAKGQRLSFEDYVGKAAPEPPAGAACTVAYSMRHPARARIARPLLRGAIYVLLMGSGLLIAVSALGVIG
jgi:hypothetical protein